MQGIFAPLAVKFIIPNLTDDQALAMDSARAVTGQRIEALPVPVGDRYVPYNDELPAKPLQKTSLMVNSCFAGFQLLLSMAAYVPLCTLVSWINIFRGLLHENYLESLVHHLVQARENSSINRASHFMLSLILLTPVSLLWSLEGFRRGNLGSLWSWYVISHSLLFDCRFLTSIKAYHVVSYSRTGNRRSTEGHPSLLSVLDAQLI
jgi:hypothetical protein